MNEQALRLLSTDQLLTQMIQLTTEVIELHRQHADKQITDERLKEIQLIQRIIVERRASETPIK